jgi:hypothetical protein
MEMEMKRYQNVSRCGAGTFCLALLLVFSSMIPFLFVVFHYFGLILNFCDADCIDVEEVLLEGRPCCHAEVANVMNGLNLPWSGEGKRFFISLPDLETDEVR